MRRGRSPIPQLFERALAELATSEADAVIAAVPVSDTIKEVGGRLRMVVRTLDRSGLWAIQTPQVFRRAPLEEASSRRTNWSRRPRTTPG